MSKFEINGEGFGSVDVLTEVAGFLQFIALAVHSQVLAGVQGYQLSKVFSGIGLINSSIHQWNQVG